MSSLTGRWRERILPRGGRVPRSRRCRVSRVRHLSRIGETGVAASLSCDDAQPSTHCDPLHGVLAQGDAPPTTIEPANRVRRSAGPTRLPREGSSPRQLSANRPLATSATGTPRPVYREAREQSVPWKNGLVLCASRPRVPQARTLDRPRKTSCMCAMSLYWQRGASAGRPARRPPAVLDNKGEHLRIDADSKRRRSATRFRGHPRAGAYRFVCVRKRSPPSRFEPYRSTGRRASNQDPDVSDG